MSEGRRLFCELRHRRVDRFGNGLRRDRVKRFLPIHPDVPGHSGDHVGDHTSHRSSLDIHSPGQQNRIRPGAENLEGRRGTDK
ncbi:hypothetical protein FNQ90_00030 [Streptomyces alkaliphilus]|uniref:Uncharacterized protein n=1 Tax=Streptomyces alkaliphilus TaxID=1472722 RepID=A0A7W3XZR1_9ACTN|nr:hypothetical protein [Streptomyces alkaliphilus]MBB0242531.1 hypothetical protein [Streptomyces alkaliphilus]